MALSESLHQNILVYFRYFQNLDYIKCIKERRFQKKNGYNDSKWMFSKNEVLKSKKASKIHFHPLEKMFSVI